MKNEKRFVKYDKELQIEAYWFQGILQKFPQHSVSIRFCVLQYLFLSPSLF